MSDHRIPASVACWVAAVVVLWMSLYAVAVVLSYARNVGEGDRIVRGYSGR